MDLGLNGKTALCMASTRGLGLGCAQALLAEGCRVVINGLNETRGRETAARLGERACFVSADVKSPEGRAALFIEACDVLGHVDILVTNADGPPTGQFLDKSIEDWRDALEQVMLSAIDMALRCVPAMTDNGFGRILNITSTSAKEPTPGTPLAVALKIGLTGGMVTLAREVADKGVTVNCVLPGPFDTELLRRAAPAIIGRPDLPGEEAVELYGQQGPMRRIGTIEEFGALCAFLCSNKAGYITGQSIVIDGGQVSLLL